MRRIGWILCLGLLALSLADCSARSRTGSERGSNPGADAGDTPTDRNSGGTTDKNGNRPDNNKPIDIYKPPPDSKCVDVFKCAKTSCQAGRTVACLDGCAKDFRGTGLARWSTLKACLQTNCSAACPNGDVACMNKCILEKCATPWTKCITDEQAGAQACGATETCAKACQAGDDVCVAQCLALASAPAQGQYNAVALCRAKEAAGPLPPQDRLSCYQADLACRCAQSQPGQGTQLCQSYVTCIAPCGSDRCCLAKCRTPLQAAEVAKADTFTLCALTQCKQCTDQKCTDECVLSKCEPQLRTCSCPGVGAPGTGNVKCQKGGECIQRCQANDFCCLARCNASMRANSYQKLVALARCLPRCGCAAGDNRCVQKCAGFGGKCQKQGIDCARN